MSVELADSSLSKLVVIPLKLLDTGVINPRSDPSMMETY